MNQIIETLKSVKGVTPADVKFVEKYIIPQFDDNKSVAVNPFSRQRFTTSPLIANLVTFIQDLIYSDFSKEYLDKYGVPSGQKIQLFDRARYLILKLSPEIYSNVID
jgi:hypothetical protein